jgi:hypothetical protein
VTAVYCKREYTLKFEHNIWEALAREGIRGVLRLADKDDHEIDADNISEGDRVWVSQRRDPQNEITIEWQNEHHVFQYTTEGQLWGKIRHRLALAGQLMFTDQKGVDVMDVNLQSGKEYILKKKPGPERQQTPERTQPKERGSSEATGQSAKWVWHEGDPPAGKTPLRPGQRRITVRWQGDEYDISFHKESALWWGIRQRVEQKGRMILAGAGGAEVPYDALENDERYDLKPVPRPAIQRRGERRVTVQWQGKEYPVSFRGEGAFWYQVRQQVEAKGQLKLVDDNSNDIQVSDLTDGGKYRLSFVNKRSYERMAAEEAEKLNMHIKVRWQNETREYSFWRQWDLWPALKEWSGITHMISLEDEDGETVPQWTQGMTYLLSADGILSPPMKETTFEWLDEEYKVKSSTEAALWRRIREQIEWSGGLQLVDDEGKQVPAKEIKEGQRYQLRPADEDQWKPEKPVIADEPVGDREPDRVKAAPQVQQQEQKITAVWVEMEFEVKYRVLWEIWPEIRRQRPEKVGWLVLAHESGKTISESDIKAGGRYHILERNTQKPELTERTVHLQWQESVIEIKYQGIGRLWRAIRDATNYSGRIEIVDDEGKRVNVAKWDISKTYTAQPERGSYKPSEIEAMLRRSKEPRREYPQRRKPELLVDPRTEEVPRIVASRWKNTSYESELTWALTKSQMSHTHPDWQSWDRRDECVRVWMHLEDNEVQEEVTLGRMAEEIEKAAAERWGVTKCTRVHASAG